MLLLIIEDVGGCLTVMRQGDQPKLACDQAIVRGGSSNRGNNSEGSSELSVVAIRREHAGKAGGGRTLTSPAATPVAPPLFPVGSVPQPLPAASGTTHSRGGVRSSSVSGSS